MSYSLHYELGYRYDETDSGSELWATRRMTYSDTTKAHLVLKEEFWDAGGATYTLYDPFDQQSWTSRVTEISSFVDGDLSSPVTSSVRTNNDDGSYDIVLFDTDGSQDYTQMRTYYAADGTITKVVTNKDDETAVTATYSGGVKTREIAVDGADNFEWASTDTRFDADGDVTKLISTADDGSEAVVRYTDGVKLVEILSDTAGTESWSTQKVRYASNGTDILYVDEISDAGVRTKSVYDPLGEKAYNSYELKFTQSGDVFSRDILYDNGRKLKVTYNADGSVASRSDADVGSGEGGLVVNGDFEQRLTGWGDVKSGFWTPDGRLDGAVGKVATPGGDGLTGGRIWQTIATEAGESYHLKFKASANQPDGGYYARLLHSNGNVEEFLLIQSDTRGMKDYSLNFTAASNNMVLQFVNFADTHFHVDNVSVTANSAGNYVWATVDTVHDANGVMESRTKTHDDGREVAETFTNGTISHREETDHKDTKAWTDITTDFDADGKLTDRVLNYDNGRVIDYDYTDGKITKKSSTDGGDAYNWTSVVDTFDISGDQLSSTQILDSGRTVEKAFTDGVRSSMTITDTANQYSWANYVYTYEADGTTYDTRVVNYDDGSSTTANWQNDDWVLV